MNEQALIIAQKRHSGQYDKQGVPYIFHPIAVMENVRRMGKGKIFQAVALLHDVLEDTNQTEEGLRVLFGDEITDAVVVLTRLEKESYTDYVKRVIKHPVARWVKLADLQHNMDETRGEYKLPESLKTRYEVAKLVVEEAIRQED